MVDVLGHLGMALLWLAPAWYVFDRRETVAALVGGGVWFGMLPDVDLVLSTYVSGVHHHGAVHTLLAVTVFAAVVGPLFGLGLRRIGGVSDRFSSGGEAATLGFAVVWVAGLSHLFADVLSAPDVAQRLEPLWPVYDGPIVLVDVLWYQSFWATWALLFAGLAVNVGAWYWTGEREEPRGSVATSR